MAKRNRLLNLSINIKENYKVNIKKDSMLKNEKIFMNKEGRFVKAKEKKQTTGYIFLPHTADVKFQAFGKSLEEAFANAAYAFTDVMTNHEKVKPKIKKRIKISSENHESLLYDFLEQFLILLDTENFLLNKIKEIKIIEKKKQMLLIASVVGDNQPQKYDIKIVPKAVTYEEMFIKHEKDIITVQVIIDI